MVEPTRSSRAGTLAKLLSGGAIGRGITAVSLLWLARLYSPESFGVLAVFATVGAFLIPLSTLRFELAIPIAQSDDEARNLIVLSSAVTLVVAAGVAILVALYTLVPGEYLSGSLPPGVAWLLPILVIGGGLYSVASYWALRLEDYGAIARTQVTRSVGQVVAQSALGVVSGSPFGLVLGFVLGRVTGVWTLVRSAMRIDPLRLESVNVRSLRVTARTFHKFPLLSTPSAVMNQMALDIPTLFLVASYGSVEAGLYFMATRAIQMPATVIAQAVSQAYVGEFSETLREGRRTRLALLVRYASRMAALALVPTIVLLLFGPRLFEFVLGAQWTVAGEYARVLALAFFAQFVVLPIAPTAFLLQKQGLQLAGDAARFALVLVAFWTAEVLGWSVLTTVRAYGIVTVVSYAALFIMYGVMARNSDRERV